jgi:periplasmic protein TonB
VRINPNKQLLRYALSAILAAGISLTAAIAQDQAGPVRIGGNVAAANRVSWVNPVYPPDAKQNRIQGTVRLEILIEKDGHVSNVTIVTGPPELTQSASDAVSQWLYKPTLLNGNPVTVLTTVDVNYTFSQ